MTLSRKIAAAVNALPAHLNLPHSVAAEAGADRLDLDLTAAGPVGVAFQSLRFAHAGRPDLSADALKAWGGRIARSVTYLMEPLVVLEVDAEAGEAELRSQAPTPRADLRSYTEVRLRRDSSLELRRVGFDEATRRRRPVPCQMTVEVVERLADDLVASVA